MLKHTFLALLNLVIASKALVAAMEWNAEEYLENSAMQRQAANELMGRLPQDISVRSIWDIGCGSGNSFPELLKRYPDAHILGLDANEDMIRLGRATFGSDDRVRFVHQSAEKYQPEEKYDLVLSSYVLHFIPPDALQEVFYKVSDRLTTKGLFAAVFSPYTRGETYDMLLRYMQTLPEFSPYLENFVKPYHSYSLGMVETLLKQAGFRIHYLGYQLATYQFETCDALKKMVREVQFETQHIAKTHPELAERYLEKLLSTVLHITKQAGKTPIVLQLPEIVFVAGKPGV